MNLMTEKKKKINYWKLGAVILGILLIVSIFSSGFKFNLGKGKIAQDTLDFINENLLRQETAQFIGVKEENGLYKITLEIGGKEFESYVTKDGRLLFPQAIDMSKQLESPVIEEKEVPSFDCESVEKTTKPKIEVYYMSFCPFGVQVIKTLNPVVKLFGEKISIEPHFVIYDKIQYQGQEDKYCMEDVCSMHGINEIKENMRQACIFKDQKEVYWDYMECVIGSCSLNNIETCWETCATGTGVIIKDVKACVDNEGVELMRVDKKLCNEKGVRGSPSVFINDVAYIGERTNEAFKEAICCSFIERPDECGEELESSVATTTGSC
jgi:glutaredoxin